MRRIATTALSVTLALGVAASPRTATAQSAPSKPSTASTTADRALQQRLHAWSACLAAISKREKAPLFFDIDQNAVPPTIARQEPAGVAGMKALGSSCRRVWKQIDGIQTFSRAGVPSGARQVADCLAWLESLDDARFADLAKGTTLLSDLSRSDQEMVSHLAGWDPDVAQALLGKSSTTEVRLVVSPVLMVTDPKTGAVSRLDIPYRPPTTIRHGGHAADTMAPLGAHTPGVLDFGEGQPMELRRIMERAGEAFGVRYEVDGRIAHTLYFISGSYQREAFEQAVAEITTVPPVQLHSGHRDFTTELASLRNRVTSCAMDALDVTELRNMLPVTGSADIDQRNAQYGAQETLDTADFLDGKTMTASQLADGRPGLAAFLQANGVAPTATVTLQAQLVLAILSDGMHESSLGSSEVNGVSAPMTSPDYALIGLE